MKITTLNLWGGRMSETLEPFFKQHGDTDIWCFQEVFKLLPSGIVAESVLGKPGLKPRMDLLQFIEGHMPGHKALFCQSFRDTYGLASFLGKGVTVIEKGEVFVARGDWDGVENDDDKDHHRKAQWMELKVDGKMFLLVNVHLTHRPAGKSDSAKRLLQSKILIEFLGMFDCPKILVGDFNLMPDTESIALFEKAGLKNLIKEYGITSTRTEVYEKPLRHADYIFVSPEIKIKGFKVLPDVVSDHAPLLLDFELP